MSCIYIESSSVLSWLLGEPPAERVVDCINRSEHIVTSVLTKLEVERSLLRAEDRDFIKAAETRKIQGLFIQFSYSWSFLSISEEVLSRASRPFPVEPVRSPDAIHLASALEFFHLYSDITVLSFDKRILNNLEPLGLIPAIGQ